MSPIVTLSTASPYPESTAAAFEMAARLGYHGLEVMVGTAAVGRVTIGLTGSCCDGGGLGARW